MSSQYKATNTHSEHIIVIVLPLQQWLHDRATILRTLPVSLVLMLQLVLGFKYV